MLSVRELPLSIRVDAGPDIGLGHFVRCLALAEYWKEHGGSVTMIGTAPEPLLRRLTSSEIGHVPVDARHPDPRDLSLTLSTMPAGTAAVLDGNAFDAGYQQALAAGRTLLVVDDTARRPRIAGDLLLNQNPGAERLPYRDAPKVRLLGARYAMLRREFRAGAPERTFAPQGTRVLVTLGGADPGNATAAVLAHLAPVVRGDLELRVVVGPANRYLDLLRSLVAELGDRVRLLVHPEMRPLMEWADLAVSAAGTTTWELAAMGVPSVLLAIAQDQHGTGREMHRQGAAMHLGEPDSLASGELATTVGRLLNDAAARRALSTAARALVDGRGCERVAEAICTHGEQRVSTESVLDLRR